MIILKILGLVLWLLIMPLVIGLLPVKLFRTSSNFSSLLVVGYVCQFALLEVVGIPIVIFFTYSGYTIFAVTLAAVYTICAVLGVVLNREYLKKFSLRNYFSKKKQEFVILPVESKIYIIVLVLLIAFQLVMVFVLASMDADDFYFNSTALSSQVYKTMYRIDANTGRNTYLDYRHCMALIPMWEAFVSSLSGVHVAIVVHKVLPLVLIPMSNVLIYVISSVLFEQTQKRMLFMILLNVFRIFGNVSFCTTETFFLLRTWQGKSVAGNFIIPLVILVFLLMYRNLKSDVLQKSIVSEQKDLKPLYGVLLLTVAASGATSSMAVLLVCALIVILALLFLFTTRNKRQFWNTVFCCIPGAVYLIIFAILFVISYKNGRLI